MAATLLHGDLGSACKRDAAGDWATPDCTRTQEDASSEAAQCQQEDEHQQQQLLLSIGGSPPYGLLWVEVQKGALLSEAQPVLVLDDLQMAAEVALLEQDMCSGAR